MSIACEFLAVKAIRDEIQRGGQSEIYKLTTPLQRRAIDNRYQVLLLFMIERICLDDKMLEGLGS